MPGFDPVAEILHAHGFTDFCVDIGVDVPAGDLPQYPLQHKAAGNGVIRQPGTVRDDRFGVAQQLPGLVLVPQHFQRNIFRQARDTAAVRQDLVNGDVVLAFARELRGVERHRVGDI